MSSNNIFKYENGKFVITEGYGSVKKTKKDIEEARPFASNLGVSLDRGAARAVALDDFKRGPGGSYRNPAPASGSPEDLPKPADIASTASTSPAPTTTAATATAPKPTKVVEPRDKGTTPMDPIDSAGVGAGVTGATPGELAGKAADDARKAREKEAEEAEARRDAEIADLEGSGKLAGATGDSDMDNPADNLSDLDSNSVVGFLALNNLDGNQIEEFIGTVQDWAKSKKISLDQNMLYKGFKEYSSREPDTRYEFQPSPELPAGEETAEEPLLTTESKYFYPRVKKSFIRHPSLVSYGYRR